MYNVYKWTKVELEKNEPTPITKHVFTILERQLLRICKFNVFQNHLDPWKLYVLPYVTYKTRIICFVFFIECFTNNDFQTKIIDIKWNLYLLVNLIHTFICFSTIMDCYFNGIKTLLYIYMCLVFSLDTFLKIKKKTKKLLH